MALSRWSWSARRRLHNALRISRQIRLGQHGEHHRRIMVAAAGAHEFVPAAHQVVMLVHHGIPHGNTAHARNVIAAVALLAHGDQMLAGRPGQFRRGGSL